MDRDAYIKHLEEENAQLKKRIEELERRLADLERRLGMNSRNSSKPPSSDMPSVFVPLPRRRRKKHGARKGHCPHLRQLLPPELVGVLTGMLNTSKRKALAVMNEVFSVPMSRIGEQLYRLAKKILRMRARVRDGTLALVTFQKRMAPLMKQVDSLLEEGTLLAKTA